MRSLSRKLFAGRRAGALLATTVAAMVVSGCATTHPPRLKELTLAEAQTFPYFRLYWAGPTFAGHALTAVDGREGYNSTIGDSVYYGDCSSANGGLGGGGSCGLPLKVTTAIYRLHTNVSLGAQRNALIRGVPATIYDKGRSIELYSGRLTIDVYSDTPAEALHATEQLRPLNAPARPGPGTLSPPVYCPAMTGPIDARLHEALQHLPGHPCQRAQAAFAIRDRRAEGLLPT